MSAVSRCKDFIGLHMKHTCRVLVALGREGSWLLQPQINIYSDMGSQAYTTMLFDFGKDGYFAMRASLPFST